MTTDQLRAGCASPCPSPSLAELEAMAREVSSWVLRHHQELPSRPIGQAASPAFLASLLHHPAPESGTPFSQVLQRFASSVAPWAFRVAHPRFLAFVPSAPAPESILADWLAAGCNFFSGVWLEAAGPSQVELTVLDWFRAILGMPTGASGLLTGGGSEANLTALATARERLGRDERPRAVLYVSQQRHWSLDRAAHVLGFWPEQVRPVEVDGERRLSIEALEREIAADRAAGRVPWAVAATAGTTNTGAVDPLPALAALCRQEGLWLHADAAYGWANALDPEGARELAGIGEADSVALDPHKWFAQGFDAGALLVRDPAALERAFRLRPEYMQDVAPATGEVNFCDRGIALTRRFRALKVWFSVQALGMGWFRGMVRHTRTLARYAEARLAEAGFEIVSPARMGVVCFRWPGSDEDNAALAEAARRTGELFMATTMLEGRAVLRFCFVNWRACADDVDAAVALLSRCADCVAP
ncbi:MAG: aminotransferase class V-fold PLP-dependent enzyme [Gemmataceae bacterium]|nr:aminotransferase class V-fold PLP-dependent enzyme [Gemmataceae bacterium]